MRRIMTPVLLLLFLCGLPAAEPIAPLDSGFKDRAFEHVRHLAGLGSRVAGTEGEAKAVRYIAEQMKSAGLNVSVERFQFKTFELDKSVLIVGEERFEAPGLGFDPYSGTTRFTGEPYFLEPDVKDFTKLNLDGRLVITTQGMSLFRLAYFCTPKVAALVPPETFDRLKGLGARQAEVQVSGKTLQLESANVVGTLNAAVPTGRFVIVSAHLDSWQGSPGAHDNASGVAVLLELARHLKESAKDLPFGVRFVALGGEELGMLGSKAYLGRHLAELQESDLVFNIDSVGGKVIGVEGRDGVQGVKAKGQNQLPNDLMDKAAVDLRSRWVLMRPEQRLMASNVPEWLQKLLADTGRDLGYQISLNRGMGSDHQVFAQAGIVATNIAISGGIKSHTPEDVPEQVDPASLEKAGRIVAGVLARLASRPQ